MAEQKQNKEQDLCVVVHRETKIKDIKKLWGIITDWGNMSYLQLVKECNLTSGKEGTAEVGSTRQVVLKNDLGELIETVTAIDNENYKLDYKLEIKTAILPVENYSAVSQLKQGKDDETVTWEGTLKFTAKQGVTNDKAIESVKGVVLRTMTQIVNHCLSK